MGAVLMFGGLAFAAIGLLYRNQSVILPPTQEDVEAFVKQVDDVPAEYLMEFWHAALEEGLGEYEDSPMVRSRAQIRFYMRMAYSGFGVAAVGLLMILGAIASRKFSQLR